MKFLEFIGRLADYGFAALVVSAALALGVVAILALSAITVIPLGVSALTILGAFFTVGIPTWALFRRPATPA